MHGLSPFDPCGGSRHIPTPCVICTPSLVATKWGLFSEITTCSGPMRTLRANSHVNICLAFHLVNKSSTHVHKPFVGIVATKACDWIDWF